MLIYPKLRIKLCNIYSHYYLHAFSRWQSQMLTLRDLPIHLQVIADFHSVFPSMICLEHFVALVYFNIVFIALLALHQITLGSFNNEEERKYKAIKIINVVHLKLFEITFNNMSPDKLKRSFLNIFL